MAVQADPEGTARRLRLWRIAGFFLGLVAPFLFVGLYLFGLVVVLGVVDWGAGAEWLGAMFVSFLVPGFVQWAWLLPMIVGLAIFRLGRGAALGLAVGGAVIFLLNAACFGLWFGLMVA